MGHNQCTQPTRSGKIIPLLLIGFFMATIPDLSALDRHPYPDVYIHYHLDIARGTLVLSHETRWTDLVAIHICMDLDKDGDGKTSAAEIKPFIDNWVNSVRRNLKVTLDEYTLELLQPVALDESLTWFAEEGQKNTLKTEWEIDLQFEIPLTPGEIPGEIILEDHTYKGKSEDEPDTYWVTNEITIVGEEGLKITQVSELPDPRYITRQIKAQWEWGGSGFAHYAASMEQTTDQRDRERLGQLLQKISNNSWYLPIALLLALLYGMGHALAPGHGKAMVAGYLVGSKGTIKDAILLGLVVTCTHTIMVFFFALVIYFMRDSFNDKTIEIWLGIASGILITLLGIWLLWLRFPWKHKTGHHTHSHHHHHHHSTDNKDKVSLPQLLWLGISGGIVPCPAALVVLLLSMRTEKPIYGLLLVVSFSIGLAGVLVAIGMLMVTSRNLLTKMDQGKGNFQSVLRLLPTISAICIITIGLLITLESWQ